MGNVKSRMARRKKKEEYGRPLPPELLFEITKFIPLTIFEEYKVTKKKKGPKTQFMIDIKNAILRKKKPCTWDIPQSTFIGPENANLLQCSSNLATFLRFRCNRLLQIIKKVNNEYIYEELRDVPKWCDSVLIISRKRTHDRPLTMHESMLLVGFCRQFDYKLCPIILSENYRTMPIDFEPDLFIDFLIEFTKRTPHPDMISKCIIHLNEQQGKNAIKAFEKYHTNSKQNFIWRNLHKPEHEYELNLEKKDANLFILNFDTLRYRLYAIGMM